ASDRFNINSQLENLQAKNVGTGRADLSMFEWATVMQIFNGVFVKVNKATINMLRRVERPYVACG
ncbi:hypothetical protein ACJX0J_014753, partial [Zea mays]